MNVVYDLKIYKWWTNLQFIYQFVRVELCGPQILRCTNMKSLGLV
jgi:hypothetical protein